MKLSDAHHLPKTVAGLSLILAPLLLLGSAVALPGSKSDEGAQLAVIAQHPDRYYLFCLLGLVGTALLVPALLGLIQMLREQAAACGYIGGGLAIVGTLLGLVDWGSELVKWQMAAPSADRTEMAALLKRFDDAAGAALPLQISGFAFLIGVVFLTIGLYRARAVPAWAPAGLLIGSFLNLAGFVASSVPLLIVSSALLLAALGWIGWTVLAQSDTEWERTPEPARPRPAAETR